MKSKFLLPHAYKKIGWFISLPFIFLGFTWTYLTEADSKLSTMVGQQIGRAMGDYSDEFISIGIFVGLLLVSFSREKDEDEYISKIRLESLQLAVLVNYVLLILATVFIYDMAYFNVMIYNMFTILLIFIIRFHFLLYRQKKSLA